MQRQQRIRLIVLLTCILGVSLWSIGWAADRPEWQITPRFIQGQELHYTGAVREQSTGRGVQFTKTYNLDVRALVLENKADGTEVGFLTRLSRTPASADKSEAADGVSLRLDVAFVNQAGRISGDGGISPSAAIDGPTTWEAGFLTEAPPAGIAKNQTWQVAETGRPPRTLRVLGVEPIGNTTCVKIVGEQQSEDWEQARADSTAWKRTETLWIIPRLGIAQRVERTVERRDPARTEATYAITTTYDLANSIRYDGASFADRRSDVRQAKLFQDNLNALVNGAKTPPRQALANLLGRIDAYIDKHPSTPYREALLRVRTLAEHGSPTAQAGNTQAASSGQRLVVGKPAPEFATENLQTHQTLSLRSWKGKTLLLVFFQPRSELTPVVMKYVEQLAAEHVDLAVLGLAMTDDRETIKTLIDRTHLTIPILSGKALRQSYDAEVTPRFVLIDAEGNTCSSYLGWGPEVTAGLPGDFKKCLIGTPVGKAPSPK